MSFVLPMLARISHAASDVEQLVGAFGESPRVSQFEPERGHVAYTCQQKGLGEGAEGVKHLRHVVTPSEENLHLARAKRVH